MKKPSTTELYYEPHSCRLKTTNTQFGDGITVRGDTPSRCHCLGCIREGLGTLLSIIQNKVCISV